VSLLELGAQSATNFEQHAKLLHGGMVPGLVFELSRTGAKKPVRAEVVRSVEKALSVDDLELAWHVMALYKLPCPNPGETLEEYDRRLSLITRVRCDRAADLICSKADRQTFR
jgi:hypothetical protein